MLAPRAALLCFSREAEQGAVTDEIGCSKCGYAVSPWLALLLADAK